MIYDITYKDPKIQHEINQLVGKPFSFLQRIKMKGNGSPSLVIKESSADITKLLPNNTVTKTANIELRPKGIVVGFNNVGKIYAWVIPYYYLHTFGTGHRLNLYGNKNKMKLEDTYKTKALRTFVGKLMKYKTEILNTV